MSLLASFAVAHVIEPCAIVEKNWTHAILSPLPSPIPAGKEVNTDGHHNSLFDLCRGICSSLLHLQMVGRR